MPKQIVGRFTEFVGRRIANRRRTKKISPEELSKKIGVSTVALDKMEHGYSHINLEQLILCAHCLSEITDLVGLPHKSDEEMKAYIDLRIGAMTEEDLRNWKANTEALEHDPHRLFILDCD